MGKNKGNDAEVKTNVMRLMEQAGVEFTPHSYAGTDALSGLEASAALGIEPERMFKTLVTKGRSGEHYVFVVPVSVTSIFARLRRRWAKRPWR